MGLGYECPARVETLYGIEPAAGAKAYACSMVYEPAEDTWLALEELEALLRARRPRLCIDVGTGTGVLAAVCTAHGVDTVAIDISPCALECARLAQPLRGLGVLVQCDSLTCIRCPLNEETLIVYNTPYLPVEDEGIEGLAWSGGMGEALRAARWASRCLARGCLVLVYSSLSGGEGELLGLLARAGFTTRVRSVHLFFEDIKVAVACRPPG